MAEKEESARGNDWEVVSLTASAYAASPGPKPVDNKEVTTTPDEADTSHPLYMSRHFVFPPPTDHDNTPTAPSGELTETYDGGKSLNKTDASGFSMEQETGSRGKEDEDLTLKGLDLSDEFAGLEFFQDKGKREEHIYKTAVSSLEDERAMGGSHVYEQNKPIREKIEPVTPCVVPNVVSPDLNPTKDEKREVAPCEAWWKRSAASLVSQVKETNIVWSIFIAAAVMGIVILGQHWQQKRLQLKWESSIGNEKAGRLMGPVSRLKQAFVGEQGQRRDSFIRVVGSQNDS